MNFYDGRSCYSQLAEEISKIRTDEDFKIVKRHIKENLNLLNERHLKSLISLYNDKGGNDSFKEELRIRKNMLNESISDNIKAQKECFYTEDWDDDIDDEIIPDGIFGEDDYEDEDQNWGYELCINGTCVTSNEGYESELDALCDAVSEIENYNWDIDYKGNKSLDQFIIEVTLDGTFDSQYTYVEAKEVADNVLGFDEALNESPTYRRNKPQINKEVAIVSNVEPFYTLEDLDPEVVQEMIDNGIFDTAEDYLEASIAIIKDYIKGILGTEFRVYIPEAIAAETDTDVEEYIADYISDETGYMVDSFDWKWEDKKDESLEEDKINKGDNE